MFSGIRVRAIKCYALTDADDKNKMEEVRMKGIPRRVHEKLNYSHFDNEDGGKNVPVMSAWSMGPTKDFGISLQVKTRNMGAGFNFKRISLVRLSHSKARIIGLYI